MNELSRTQLLLKFYKTSSLYLLITAFATALIFLIRLTTNFQYAHAGIVVVHLGTLGALTLGLMGFYLRLIFSVGEVEISEWAMSAIHAVMNIGIIVLAAGFLAGFWPLLVLGAIGVTYAVLWWALHYIRWFIRVPSGRKGGALLFGLFAVVGLVVAVLIGGYLIHGHLTDSVSQNIRLAHIHSGFVGWATLGLLGIGVALRGGDVPLLNSIPILRGTSGAWFAGTLLLVLFMAIWQISLVMIAGAILFLAFLGYGYSMPKTGASREDSGDDDNGGGGLLPYVIAGFIGLFLTILIGFDITINYPSGRAGIHQVFGVGVWLLMTFLMALLAEFPKSAYVVLRHKREKGAEMPAEMEYRYPGMFQAGWIGITVTLLITVAGYFMSQSLFFTGILLLGLVTSFLASYVLVKYWE